ncbi:hypothetical protein C0J52_10332 [Blattella germanica]|nr:hypothetical protein C0J52_10332 [Blattella germanica]
MMESDTSGKESSDGQTPPKRNKNELPQKLSAEKRSEKSPNVFKGDTPKPERKRKTPTRPPRQLAPKRETGSIKKSLALKVLEKYKKRHKSNLIEKCLECGKKFASKHAMLKHKERKHNILECHICKRTHKAPGALEKHFRDKHLMEGPPYICSYCPFSNNSISLFILHTRTTHKIKELCPYCPGVFATKKSLCLHIISKHTAINATRLNCQICKVSFASTHALKVHFKTLHSSTNKWFTCIHCETFVHEKQYGMHMRKHKHSLRCRLCQREFISHRSFHVHRCSRNIYTNRTRQRYTCETCGVKFGSKEVLEGHSYIHKFDVVYVCKICRKQISNILEVYMHGKQCPTPQTSISQGSTNKRDASTGRRIDAKSSISTDKFKTVNSIVSAQKLSLAAGSQVVAKDDTNVKFNTLTSKLTRNFEIQPNQLVKKLESTSVLLKERDRIPTATISRTYSDQHTQVLTKASGHLTAKMSSLPIEHKIKTNRNIGAVGSSSPTVKAEKLSDSLRHNTPSKMSLIVSKLQLGDLANPKEVKLLTSTGSLITIKTGVSEMLKPKTKSTTEYPVTPKTTNDLVQGTGQSTAAQQIMVHQSRGKALQVLNTIKHIDRTIPKNKNTLFMNCQKCGLKCNSAKELSSHNCMGCKYIYLCHRCTSIFLSESVFNLHSCQGATKPVTPAVEKNASSSTASEVKFHLKPEYFVYNTQSSCSGIPYLKSNKATATGSLTHASYKEIASVSSSVMQSDPNTKHKPKFELNSSDSTGSGSEVGFPCIPYQKVFKNKEILKNHNCRPRKVRNTTNKSSFKSAPSGEKGYSCSSQLQLSRSSQNTVYITDSNPGIDDATETRDANQFQSSQEAHPAEKFIEQSPFEIINISDGIILIDNVAIEISVADMVFIQGFLVHWIYCTKEYLYTNIYGVKYKNKLTEYPPN